MRYSVNLRMKNPGPTKYLVESAEKNDLIDAFYLGVQFAKSHKLDHYVEIVDNENGEIIAMFSEPDVSTVTL